VQGLGFEDGEDQCVEVPTQRIRLHVDSLRV